MKAREIGFWAAGLAWAASLAWFGLSAGGCPRQLRPNPGPGAGDSESWFGLYMGADKIGHSVTLSRSLPAGGRAVSSRSLMRFSMMGAAQEVASALSYDLDGEYALKRFDFRLSGAAEIRVSGQVRGRKLLVDVESGGRSQRQELALSGPVTLPEAMEPLLAGRRLEPGDRRVYSVFDPSSLSLQPATITVAARESLALTGRTEWSLRLQVEFAGITSRVWVDTLGRTLREEGPMGIVLVAEPRESALRMDGSDRPLDLLASLSVPALGRRFEDPRGASSAAYRLLDIEAAGFDLEGGRQRMADGLLEVSREKVPGPRAGPAPDSLRQWLGATALIQSGDPAVRALADSICAGISDPWQRSLALSDWVFASLEKRMSVTLPSAVEVLASRRGDCNEHATLFCALARSAGVPARLCLGVVFLDGRFYYHAWNAVWCGGWIELDPTFGQAPADAARIRLVSGDLVSQTRLLPAMGRLKVEVVEAR